MKRKIVFVDNDVNSFRPDRMELIYAARDMGFEIHVAAPMGRAASNITKEGFTFHDISMSRKGTGLWTEFATILNLFRLYRRLRPVLVHHFRLKPVLYGSVAASLARVPAVANTLTGLGYIFTDQSKKTAFLRKWVKAGCAQAFRHQNLRVIFQNPDDRAIFIRDRIVSSEQAALIKGSGVDTTLFYPSHEPDGLPVVIVASRMLWNKGIVQFVEAARALTSQGVQAKFVLVGDTDSGNPTEIPKEQLHEWQANGWIEWWGARNDMPDVLANSHIVCLPSYREGIPRILIEAAASGRPIITTDAPGCRELVRPGENGLLVPVGNVEALTIALRTLINNPELRKRMGTINRQVAEQEFANVVVIPQSVSLYHGLLQRASSAPEASFQRYHDDAAGTRARKPKVAVADKVSAPF
jgi:glycosyltransferase involved in cell wall biosynthesis